MYYTTEVECSACKQTHKIAVNGEEGEFPAVGSSYEFTCPITGEKVKGRGGYVAGDIDRKDFPDDHLPAERI